MNLHNDKGRAYSLAFSGAEAVDISSKDFVPKEYSQIYVGKTGDIKVDTIDNTGITFKSVPVGILPVLVTKVYKNGTTAEEMIALR